MSVRPDNRLDDCPMTRVGCPDCGARVEARKSSWDQTSIQWSEEAQQRCLERRAFVPRLGVNGAVFEGCHALRQAVRRAAVSGALPVVADDGAEEDPVTGRLPGAEHQHVT